RDLISQSQFIDRLRRVFSRRSGALEPPIVVPSHFNTDFFSFSVFHLSNQRELQFLWARGLAVRPLAQVERQSHGIQQPLLRLEFSLDALGNRVSNGGSVGGRQFHRFQNVADFARRIVA